MPAHPGVREQMPEQPLPIPRQAGLHIPQRAGRDRDGLLVGHALELDVDGRVAGEQAPAVRVAVRGADVHEVELLGAGCALELGEVLL